MPPCVLPRATRALRPPNATWNGKILFDVPSKVTLRVSRKMLLRTASSACTILSGASAAKQRASIPSNAPASSSEPAGIAPAENRSARRECSCDSEEIQEAGSPRRIFDRERLRVNNVRV